MTGAALARNPMCKYLTKGNCFLKIPSGIAAGPFCCMDTCKELQKIEADSPAKKVRPDKDARSAWGFEKVCST